MQVMENAESTCWTVIKAAAAGSPENREEFARLYRPIVTRYFAFRWRCSPSIADVDDAVQDVFVECFKQDGVLERAGRDRGFRPFLYGVVRNVALRFESERKRARERHAVGNGALEALPDTEEQLSRVFDRDWARQLLRTAAQTQEERARNAGTAACWRVELLRLRFQEGISIRDIATRWQAD